MGRPTVTGTRHIGGLPVTRDASVHAWRIAASRQYETVIDHDTLVADARRDVTRALQALREALRERDRAEAHLRLLLEEAEAEGLRA